MKFIQGTVGGHLKGTGIFSGWAKIKRPRDFSLGLILTLV
jgi:hypothetical protein